MIKCSVEKKREVATHLAKLGRGEIEPKDKRLGICWEVDLNFFSYYDYTSFYSYFRSWNKFSGNNAFPITSTSLYTNYSWEIGTSAGDLRRELCLHMAKELRKEAANQARREKRAGARF